MADSKLSPKEEYFKKYKRDIFEMTREQIVETDFPEADFRWRLIQESFNSSIEESYFWIHNYLIYEMGYADIDKITDLFAATEHSSFFGVAQQKIGLQQDKVSQYLAVIGKMVKELFQIVRELRILDERIGYYDGMNSEDKKTYEPAMITLKSLYIDTAEGGSKSPASIWGLARELQFTTLPDLFFSINVKDVNKIDETVEKLQFNKQVRHILKRKLFSFLQWKENTEHELKSRRTFTVKYLKQHFDIIKMYMSWVKPYLRNIERLRLDSSRTETPDMVAAFEGSMIEIEILAKFWPEGNNKYMACTLIHFEYRTVPQMNYQQEYQRGPLHVGQVRITYRPYVWTEDDVKAFKDMRNYEDFDMLASIDGSVKAAMEALGDDLMNYLKEAGAETPEKKEEKQTGPPGIIDGFKRMFTNPAKPDTPKKPKKPKVNFMAEEKEKKAAKKEARQKTWLSYKNYKKAHKMLTW